MRYAKLGGLGICAATALWGGTAMAQEFFTPRMMNNSYVSLNTRPAISDLSFSLQETYDSNVAESDAAIAAARGIHQSDWLFTPSVGLNLVVPRGLTTFFAGGEVAYNFYNYNHRFNRAHIDVFGGATTHFLCEDSLIGDFADTHQNNLIAATSQGITNSQASGGVTLKAECGQKYGLSPGFSVGERWSTNSAAEFAPTDYRMFIANAELNYNRPVFGSLGLYGEYNNLTFTHDLFLADVFLRDGFNDFAGGVVFKHDGTRLYVNAKIGYNDLVPDISSQPGYSGLSYALDVRYDPVGPRLQAVGGFSRATLPSDLPFATYMVESTYYAGLSFAANDRVRFGVDGQIQHSDYRGSPFLDTLLVNNQTLYRVGGKVDFWATRNFDFALRADEVKRDTDTPGFNYTATIVSASITTKFGT